MYIIICILLLTFIRVGGILGLLSIAAKLLSKYGYLAETVGDRYSLSEIICVEDKYVVL